MADGDGGRMVQAEASIVTPQDVTGLAMSIDHREMSTRASESVAGFASPTARPV